MLEREGGGEEYCVRSLLILIDDLEQFNLLTLVFESLTEFFFVMQEVLFLTHHNMHSLVKMLSRELSWEG